MEQVSNPRTVARLKAANVAPAPPDPADANGEPASKVYQNVQVLNDLSVAEFTRVMIGDHGVGGARAGLHLLPRRGEPRGRHRLHQGRGAAHAADDAPHQHRLEDPRRATGVTCYTCHRGKPVPANIWFNNPGPRRMPAEWRATPPARTPRTRERADVAAATIRSRLSCTTNDPARVIATGRCRPARAERRSRQTEQTYALMMHMSKALGVNCTFCHNSRSFSQWEESTPQRVTAWHGIRMVRDLNATYLEPLKPTYPANRLGPLGDAPKMNCTTCHQGVNKPLYGAQMAKDYPELLSARAPK